MNKPAIATIIATAALSIVKKASGSQNNGVTVTSIDELIRHANDPNLAPLVTTVSIEGGYLTEIPPEIFKLKNLERLELQENDITSIPSEIGNLTNLKLLALQENEITSIPPEIGNLTNLTGLLLYTNSITEIPSEIGNLINLEDFNLRRNGNLKIPPSQIRKMIQRSGNPKIAKELMRYIDTNSTPTSSIRRF